MDTITMTAEELSALKAELAGLESAGRAEIAARIKTAREWGDLKENGEYHAAKEAQAHLETKILRLRAQMKAAVIVEEPGGRGGQTVRHGSRVTVTDLGSERVRELKIVSPNEAKPAEGLLSTTSPVAQALVGRAVGDVAEVSTPGGTRRLRIETIG
jgi:transcription elongation factor GreA